MQHHFVDVDERKRREIRSLDRAHETDGVDFRDLGCTKKRPKEGSVNCYHSIHAQYVTPNDKSRRDTRERKRTITGIFSHSIQVYRSRKGELTSRDYPDERGRERIARLVPRREPNWHAPLPPSLFASHRRPSSCCRPFGAFSQYIARGCESREGSYSGFRFSLFRSPLGRRTGAGAPVHPFLSSCTPPRSPAAHCPYKGFAKAVSSAVYIWLTTANYLV